LECFNSAVDYVAGSINQFSPRQFSENANFLGDFPKEFLYPAPKLGMFNVGDFK
jgi:hypothetical protein